MHKILQVIDFARKLITAHLNGNPGLRQAAGYRHQQDLL